MMLALMNTFVGDETPSSTEHAVLTSHHAGMEWLDFVWAATGTTCRLRDMAGLQRWPPVCWGIAQAC
jgi:hypothetical protein